MNHLQNNLTFSFPVLCFRHCIHSYTAIGDPAHRPGFPQPWYWHGTILQGSVRFNLMEEVSPASLFLSYFTFSMTWAKDKLTFVSLQFSLTVRVCADEINILILIHILMRRLWKCSEEYVIQKSMFLKVVFDLYTFSYNLFMTLVYFGLFRLFLQSFSNVFFVYCIAISHLFLTNHCQKIVLSWHWCNELFQLFL